MPNSTLFGREVPGGNYRAGLNVDAAGVVTGEVLVPTRRFRLKTTAAIAPGLFAVITEERDVLRIVNARPIGRHGRLEIETVPYGLPLPDELEAEVGKLRFVSAEPHAPILDEEINPSSIIYPKGTPGRLSAAHGRFRFEYLTTGQLNEAFHVATAIRDAGKFFALQHQGHIDHNLTARLIEVRIGALIIELEQNGEAFLEAVAADEPAIFFAEGNP